MDIRKTGCWNYCQPFLLDLSSLFFSPFFLPFPSLFPTLSFILFPPLPLPGNFLHMSLIPFCCTIPTSILASLEASCIAAAWDLPFYYFRLFLFFFSQHYFQCLFLVATTRRNGKTAVEGVRLVPVDKCKYNNSIYQIH